MQAQRLRTPLSRTQRTTLKGHVHPLVAGGASDLGPADNSFTLPAVTLYFKRSPAQQAALNQLLADQQNPNSPRYHQWLTPEQFAERFGATESDYNQVTEWLKSEGFQVAPAARGRGWIRFQATAAQIETSFQTSIHRYQATGKVHYANASDPSIPATFEPVVQSIRGLHDFRRTPRLHKSAKNALYNFSDGTHGMVPDDFATIYDVAPLYAAGIDGTGQKIVIAGQTAIIPSDLQRFRSRFNLSAQTVQQVLAGGATDPGVVDGDIDEANLDIQWAGAVARKATIVYVYSGDVQTSIEWAIDNNLAPVISASYGICEAYDLVDSPATQATAQQGNAQGQTWLNASGDAGATDCDNAFSAPLAQAGLAVTSPADIPEITGVGGSQFNDGSGNYWAAANNTNLSSALSYIPEVVWNTSIVNGALSAGGGGTSVLFPKPVWQTGPGVPSGGFRNVPDIAFNSSDNTPAYVYSQGLGGYFFGTSLATPTMAGVVALLNQYLTSTGAPAGVGNINPALYRMAQANTGAFHDITSGDNASPCAAGSPDCVNGFEGYSAGPGYDRATGLGSLDVNVFVHKWTSSPPVQSMVVPSLDQIPVFQDPATNKWTFTLTLTEEAGIATTVTGVTIDGKTFDAQSLFGTTAIPANNSISASMLSLTNVTVPKTVVFHFTGKDGNGTTWAQDYSVPFQGPLVSISVAGASNAASGQQAFAPGEVVSVYGVQFGGSAVAASAIPLPWLLSGFEADVDGTTAPLYYVSPGQVNIQIPYETIPGKSLLTVGNPYTYTTFPLTVVSAAPGIFASNGFAVPYASAARGQTTTIFITGEGQVRPSLATGDTPDPSTPLSGLPKPRLAQSMTVGGQAATITFIGIPSGLVGVTQVNFTVPANAPLGVQPVIVTIGTAASLPVNLTVTQ
jgi:uncharacterized protein (TIGR03437 family)